MKKFLISAAAAATLIGGSFALAAWSPMGTAGAQEGDTSTMDQPWITLGTEVLVVVSV